MANKVPLNLAQTQDLVEEHATTDYYRDAYRVWESRYLPHICALLEPMEPMRVLDIGPGWGTMMAWLHLHGWEVTVMDTMTRDGYINAALCESLGTTYLSNNIETGTGTDETFPLVLMTQVITHLLWRPDAALQNVARLAEDAAIISVTDAEQHPYGKVVRYDDWHDVPSRADGAEPQLAATNCTYTEETFDSLLHTAFSEVAIGKPEVAQTMIAECKGPQGH